MQFLVQISDGNRCATIFRSGFLDRPDGAGLRQFEVSTRRLNLCTTVENICSAPINIVMDEHSTVWPGLGNDVEVFIIPLKENERTCQVTYR